MEWDRREMMRVFTVLPRIFMEILRKTSKTLSRCLTSGPRISAIWKTSSKHLFRLLFVTTIRSVCLKNTHTQNKLLSESVNCTLLQFGISSVTLTPLSLAQVRESLTVKAVQTNKWMASIQNYHELTCFSAPPGLASQPRAQLPPRGTFVSPIPSVPSLVQIRVSQLVRKIPYSFWDSVGSLLPSCVVQQACFWASHYLRDA